MTTTEDRQLADQAIRTQSALDRVAVERDRQVHRWGTIDIEDQTPGRWLAILVEEVGEVAAAMKGDDPFALRSELEQVAAVSVAMIEHLNMILDERLAPRGHR